MTKLARPANDPRMGINPQRERMGITVPNVFPKSPSGLISLAAYSLAMDSDIFGYKMNA